MLTFFRKKHNKVEPWASFFSEEEFKIFTGLIEKILKDQNYKRDGDSIIWGNNHVTYLNNVARFCKQAKIEDWESILIRFFAQFSSMNAISQKLDELLADFESAKDHLVARIVIDSYFSVFDKNNVEFVFRRDIPETLTVLMVDSGTSLHTVTKDQIKNWNVDEKTIFDCAIENVAQKYEFETTVKNLHEKGNVNLNFVFSPDTLASSIPLLFTSKFNDYVGKYGVLFCIPTTSICILHSFNDANAYVAVYDLFKLAYQYFHTEPKSVSSNVYWYRDGQCQVLDIKLKDQKIDFKPSESFVNCFDLKQ